MKLAGALLLMVTVALVIGAGAYLVGRSEIASRHEYRVGVSIENDQLTPVIELLV